MGIKDVNAVVKEHAPGAFLEIPLSNLKGHRVAIDGNGWTWARVASSNRTQIERQSDPLVPVNRRAVMEQVYLDLVRFNREMATAGVTLVWCWDGQRRGAKQKCLEGRENDREKTKTRVQEAAIVFQMKHPLMRTKQDIAAYKKVLVQYNWVSSEEMESVRALATELGFASIVAPYDGEKYCASLSIEGLVTAVWSIDTDNYALGTNMMITGWGARASYPDYQAKLSVVIIPYIRHFFGFDQKKLVDLCILLGCDFGTRMPGVGPKTIWDLLQKYDGIDEIAKAEPSRPIQLLNHVECRELFAYEPTGLNTRSPELNFNSTKFLQRVAELSKLYGFTNEYQGLVEAVKFLPSPSKIQITLPTSTSNSEAVTSAEAGEKPASAATLKGRFLIV